MEYLLEPTQLPVVAVFDFDGTLTRRDTLLPFLRLVAGRSRFWLGIIFMSPVLAGYALKLIPNWRAKESLLTHFLGGRPERQSCHIAEQFAIKEIPNQLRTETVKRLLWHQSQNHQTILVSASLEIYLLPWAKTMGFDQAIGTQLDVQNGRITGRILGRNCYGAEKVKRLQAVLGDLSQYCIYAYGDSRGDRELLEVANYPYYRPWVMSRERGSSLGIFP
jgi:phosphatidylglycerophosphatase C